MTTRTLSHTAILAKEIRAKLKAAGIVASVRTHNYSMGSSLYVEYVSGGYKACKEIAKEAESIRYCHASGEILSGGNRFVSVDLDRDTVKAMVASLLPAVSATIAGLDAEREGTGLPIAGHDAHIAREGYGFALWMGHEHIGSYPSRDALEVAERMAYKILQES